jgi:hypothetical protein
VGGATAASAPDIRERSTVAVIPSRPHRQALRVHDDGVGRLRVTTPRGDYEVVRESVRKPLSRNFQAAVVLW